MNVRVCGPNLRDQSKGTFHVHADGCADLKKYGPHRNLGGDVFGEAEMLVKDASVKDVIEMTYGEILDENPNHKWSDSLYTNDFWFAPCCRDIPYRTTIETLPDGTLVRSTWLKDAEDPWLVEEIQDS